MEQHTQTAWVSKRTTKQGPYEAILTQENLTTCLAKQEYEGPMSKTNKLIDAEGHGHSITYGCSVIIHRKREYRVIKWTYVLRYMWGWLNISAITNSKYWLDNTHYHIPYNIHDKLHFITLFYMFLHTQKEQLTNGLSSASLQQHCNVFLPYCHHNIISALCSPGSLLTRDYALMFTLGIIYIQLRFNFLS